MRLHGGLAPAAFFVMTALLAGCATGPSYKDIAAEYYNVGNAYFDIGQFDKAAKFYSDAMRLDPSLTLARYNLALTLIQAQKYQDGEKLLIDLLAGDPQNTTVLATLGWAYHAEGKDEEALARYDRILEISPENQNALYNSALLLWKMDHKDQAVDRYKKLLAIAPDNEDALYGIGSLLLSLDDPQTAIEYLNRYLQHKPDDADAQLLLADGYERLKKYSQALEAYDKITTSNSKEPRAWFGKARLLLTVIEDPDKGLNALNQALQLGFHDMDAIKTLLDSPQLQSRDDIEAALKAKDMLPKEEPAPQGTTPPDQTPG
jgi:tetratricopeptide (TPR) repeat protein